MWKSRKASEGKRSDLETPGADAKGIRGPNGDNSKANKEVPGKVNKFYSRVDIRLMEDDWSFDHGRYGS